MCARKPVPYRRAESAERRARARAHRTEKTPPPHHQRPHSHTPIASLVPRVRCYLGFIRTYVSARAAGRAFPRSKPPITPSSRGEDLEVKDTARRPHMPHPRGKLSACDFFSKLPRKVDDSPRRMELTSRTRPPTFSRGKRGPRDFSPGSSIVTMYRRPGVTMS